MAASTFTIDDAERDLTLAATLRRRLPETTWSEARRLCETGKVRLDGEVVLDSAARVRASRQLSIDMAAPRPRVEVPGFRIAFEDGHVVIIEKPAGVTSVPYERKETGTALDLIRAHWRRSGKRATATPLYTVHRLDKDTSGLLCFAKTRLAERALHQVFQRHTATREYLAVAQGRVETRRIESVLVADRGDGIRGSLRRPDGEQGQRAVTHVTVLRHLRAATLIRVRLETGRTHQIRVHLAEAGHPLVGETVYVRDLLRAGGQPLPSPRLLLHAATLGLPHPVTGAAIDLRAEPPADFIDVLEALGGSRDDVGAPTMPDGTIRSALAAIYDVMRSGYAPGAPKAQDQPDAGHDPAFLDRAAPLLEFLWSKYFRVRLLGLENIPDKGAALLVANHSGGIPYDGTLLLYGIHRDHPLHRRVRPLVANFVFRAGWMSQVVARVGGVRASTDTALPLLADGQLLAVFPEGLKGVGKLYRERYRLNRFGRGGFARLARAAGVPMIPVAIVGAEEIHPVIGKITALAEPLGIPYIPITPTFPWLGPLGLLPVPTKWTIQIGEPIPAPVGDDPQGTTKAAEAVRSAIDLMISDLLAQRRSILFG